MSHKELLTITLLAALTGCMLPVGSSIPKLKTENVSVSAPDIRIWNVEPTSDIRQGSTTSNEAGSVNVNWSDGSTTTHDANFKVQSGTLFQDGKVCHNYGPKCYCATTTFRLESGNKLWKFGTPSNNTPVDCPSGATPTGDAEIRKSLTAEDREALKQKIMRERASGRKSGH